MAQENVCVSEFWGRVIKSCLDCYAVRRMAGARAVGSSYKRESTCKCTVLMLQSALFVSDLYSHITITTNQAVCKLSIVKIRVVQ